MEQIKERKEKSGTKQEQTDLLFSARALNTSLERLETAAYSGRRTKIMNSLKSEASATESKAEILENSFGNIQEASNFCVKANLLELFLLADKDILLSQTESKPKDASLTDSSAFRQEQPVFPQNSLKLRSQRNRTLFENQIDLQDIICGANTKTTIMMRNIPSFLTSKVLVKNIFEVVGPVFDVFYLPMDFDTGCNKGYAFVNFAHHLSILTFYKHYHNVQWSCFGSSVTCELSYGKIQGKLNLLKKYSNADKLKGAPECYRPICFKLDSTPIVKVPLEFKEDLTRSNLKFKQTDDVLEVHLC